MEYSFKGGIKLNEKKNNKANPLIRMPAPNTVKIPLCSGTESFCVACVHAGSEVKVGTLIGVGGENGCDVHSSVSGKVIAIEEITLHSGIKAPAVVIENDFRESVCEEIKPFSKKISETDPQEIIRIIKKAGIIDHCGSTMPLYKKIDPEGYKIKNIIINLAESDPYLSSRYKLIKEYANEILGGTKIVMRAIATGRAIFAVENTREDIADAFMSMIGDNKAFGIKFVKSKYPQDKEKELILAIRKKEIPLHKSSKNIGSIVLDAESLKAVYDAFILGMPAVERNITVGGNCIGEPTELQVAIGTGIEDIINFCGGYKKKPRKIICGGIMTGYLQKDTSTVVSKDLSGVICIASKPEMNSKPRCINCGRCVKACPMKLMPFYLSRFSVKSDTESALKYGIESCNECGCCTYVCPGRVDILENIKIGKELIKAERE